MKPNHSAVTKLTYLILIFFLVVLSGCQQNESNQPDNANTPEINQTAPEIPPPFTMSLPEAFSNNLFTVQSQSDGSITAQSVTAQSIFNFGYAAINVGVWNTVLAINLAVPTAAFLESFRHLPSLRSDDIWVWSYSVTVAGIIHTVELHAQINEEEVFWEMYVTKPGNYLDFNWFSGVSAVDGSGGTWTLRKDPDDPKPYLAIEWSRDKETNTGSALYSNVLSGSDDNGSYIFYGITTDQPYNAFYDIYSTRIDHFVEIEWNRSDKSGRVRNPYFFLDEDWHYWDDNLQDIPAPQ